MNKISRKGLYSTGSGENFIESLAAGLIAEFSTNPIEISHCLVYLPNRRAIRNLSEAIFKISRDDSPQFLPRLLPLGEAFLDEFAQSQVSDLTSTDPTATVATKTATQMQRLMVMSQLIRRHHPQPLNPSHAVGLAQALARLWDEMLNEAIGIERLKQIVPENYAERWQESLALIEPVIADWQGWLKAAGMVDSLTAHEAKLRQQIAAWRATPVDYPIIIAGTMGQEPIVRDLIETVLDLPQGIVLLPAVDRQMGQKAWEKLPETHAQYLLKNLLEKLTRERGEVAQWQSELLQSPAAAARTSLFAAATESPATITQLRQITTQATDLAVKRFDLPNRMSEARLIALLMRETIQEPDKTAALVTNDKSLARLVSSELTRYGLTVDDSGGVPLLLTASGAFMRLIVAALVNEAKPSDLLALLEHPYCTMGMERQAVLVMKRQLEIRFLRGPRPSKGLVGIANAITARVNSSRNETENKTVAAIKDWFSRLQTMVEPFVQLIAPDHSPSSIDEIALTRLIASHILCSESLASDQSGKSDRLWAEEDGKELAAFMTDFAKAAVELHPIKGNQYYELFVQFAQNRPVYWQFPKESRLFIWRPREARLRHTDRVILGGLNEGSWPNSDLADPWLSRDMREKLGLASADRLIGQAAHDFQSLFGAKELVLTRSERSDGVPNQPSRWLRQIDRQIELVTEKTLSGDSPHPWLDEVRLHWLQSLDQPKLAMGQPIAEPNPKPPLIHRPKRFSPSAVALWMKNPYGFYAKYILQLVKLEPLDGELDARDRGTIIHAALREFVQQYPHSLPDNGLAKLQEIGKMLLDEKRINHPEIVAFWQPRFSAVAEFFYSSETERRGEIAKLFAELHGEITLPSDAGEITLHCTADRIEQWRDGRLVIVDYKTGNAPVSKSVEQGFEPQLPLEGVIARHGGFKGVIANYTLGTESIQLEYWQLKGRGSDGNKIMATPSKKKKKSQSPETADNSENGENSESQVNNAENFITAAHLGLIDLVNQFNNPERGYNPSPHSRYDGRYNDYLHLSRLQEWGVAEENDK